MKKLLLGRVSLVAGALLIMAGAAATACGDDDDDNGTTPDSGKINPEAGAEASTTTGTVSGEATYNGTKKGPLIIGILPSMPVPGQPPPTPIAVGSNESPTWPGKNAFSVKNVPPGSYFVAAFIMVGPEHRQQGAQLADPITMPPVAVTVTAGGTATANLNLGDRPQPEAGVDGGEDGGDGDGGDGG